MKESLYDYCIRIGNAALPEEWHTEKNGGLTPKEVSYGSQLKVWWRCKKGHEWQTMVKSRAAGCGCPVCAGRLLLPGENDLATVRPDLAAQWHPEKNGGLTPEAVMPGTRKKVWWRCGKGHEWQAAVRSRSQGADCPVCAGKEIVRGENDFASQFPALAAQWDTRKNGALTPENVAAYSNRRIWWRCEKGHSYRTMISYRTLRGDGCPYCAGRRVMSGFNDLGSLEPKIAAQWHSYLNAGLTPEMVTVGAHRRVWWECEEGHVWKAFIYSRTGPGKCGCPVCSGRTKKRPRRRYAADGELKA